MFTTVPVPPKEGVKEVMTGTALGGGLTISVAVALLVEP